MTTIITTEKIKSSDKIGITEPLIKPPRLTKKGKIDKRSITSKKNLEKGVKYVKEIIDKARALHPKNCDDIESDTEEYEIILKKDPIPVPVSIPVSVTTGLSEVNVIKENSPKNIIENYRKKLDEEYSLKEQKRIKDENLFNLKRKKLEAYYKLNSMSQNMACKF